MLSTTNLFESICILSCVKVTTSCCWDLYRDIKTCLHGFRYEVLVTLQLSINIPVSFLTTEFIKDPLARIQSTIYTHTKYTHAEYTIA
jgi:hypothetical protein